MKVRFGFVAMALSLKNASPSKTMTYKTFSSITDREAALRKATRIAENNLSNSLRILRHAYHSGIYLYRFSSKLIPLYGLPETENWNFIEKLRPQFVEIGNFVKSHGMRVSFHPDHFVVLNSPAENVFHNSLKNLDYHVQMFEAMGLENEKMVLHVGGGYQDKEASLKRFRENWGEVPKEISRRLMLENDDKLYTAKDVQRLSVQLQVPMVLDVHHHRCNQEPGDELSTVVGPFLQSWEGTSLPPKAHISSPKDEKNFRAHSDTVDIQDLIPFLDIVRETNTDIDVMVEAKKKDEAVFRLVEQLGRKKFVRPASEGSVEYRP